MAGHTDFLDVIDAQRVLLEFELAFDRALALARRVTESELPTKQIIDRLFRLIYGRTATDTEVAMCGDHWSRMTDRHQNLTFSPPKYPHEVQRVAVEENTGEKFSFVEPLEFYEKFVPDLKPADTSPELRGLAEVCLVLLNSNEFLYVY